MFGTLNPTSHYAADVLTGFGVRPASWQGSVLLQHELRPRVGLTLGYYRTWFVNQRVTQNVAVSPDAYDPYCVTLPADSRLPGGGGNELCGFYDVKPAFFGLTDSLVTLASHFKSTEIYNGSTS